MFTITRRIWISLLLIIGTGISTSVYISSVGDQAAEASADLIYKQLPRLAVIKGLRSAITEHERLQYELYATADAAKLDNAIADAKSDIVKSMMIASQSFAQGVADLPALFVSIEEVSHRHYRNLTNPPTHWDQARADLEELTALGAQAETILLRLTESISSEASAAAENAQQQIQLMVALVIGFAVLVIIMAVVIAMYARNILKDRAERRALALFPERNPKPVVSITWSGDIRYQNPAFTQLLGDLNLSPEQPEQLLPPTFKTDLAQWQSLKSSQIDFTHQLNGRMLLYSISLFRDLESCHLYVEDITEKQKAQKRLEYQACHDVLTGLFNRSHFENQLAERLQHQMPCSLLLVTMDRFKLITASQGYEMGDGLILAMAHRLRMLCQAQTAAITLFRLEAAVFCLLVDSADTALANQLADTLRNAMDEPLEVTHHKYFMTLSMGLCHYPKDGENITQLISNGHSALHHAKRVGDTLEDYEPRFHAEEQSWLPIESGLRDALANNELTLHYQAKVDAKTTAIRGAEALVRWQQPDGNMVSPGVFIPIAEQTGLIIRMGEWIIEQACRQSVVFNKKHEGIQVAINLSARQFQHRYFLQQLQRILDETGANPQRIELEITEGLIMENVAQSIKIMRHLKDMGFSLAIDDFGTGYSSLSYLKQFPVDTLKIDQAFVRNLEQDEDDRSIIRNIIDLANVLKLKTVAEGVETKGQWQFLRSLNCHYIQGYYFSKPDVADKLLRKR